MAEQDLVFCRGLKPEGKRADHALEDIDIADHRKGKQ
jgi:hypothetical protein